MTTFKVAQTPRESAVIYLRKAEQFSSTARDALAAGEHDSALLCAVHAGISSADAVTVGLRGRRSLDPDHQRVVDLLEDDASRSPDVKTRASQLRALLKMKNLVEYEARNVTPTEADDGVKRCARLVDWARAELVRARLA